MTTPLVYSFRCRLSPDAERLAFAEVTRQRELYNSMIAEYNPHPRQRPLTVMARHKLAAGDCYTGSHFAAIAAFNAATSAKRLGKFPGDPYRFRNRFSLSGAKVGSVWMANVAPTWGMILAGKTSRLRVSPGDKRRRNYSACSLKISKLEAPIEFTANVRRPIPLTSKVTAAYLVPDGDTESRHWWDLQITFMETEPVVAGSRPPCNAGIDLGWQMREDGSLLVAKTSLGEELAIPPYAIRMAKSIEAVQAQRDTIRNLMLDELSKNKLPCLAKSAGSVLSWIEQRNYPIEQWLMDKAVELRWRQQHLRRRFDGIRDELYRDFAACHIGSYIKRTDLKKVAEEDLKGEESNH